MGVQRFFPRNPLLQGVFQGVDPPPPPTAPPEATAASETDLMKFHTGEQEAELLKDSNIRGNTEWNDKGNSERAKLEVEMERPLGFSIGHSIRLEWASAQNHQ